MKILFWLLLWAIAVCAYSAETPVKTGSFSTFSWTDAYARGCAAATAGDRGTAAVALLAAHRGAVLRDEPRAALRAIGVALPTTWCEWLGPLAAPARGWSGLALCALAGLALGVGLGLRSGRRWALVIGGLAMLAVAPGLAAANLDARTPWAVTRTATALFDSGGALLQPLPAGTLVRTGRTVATQVLVTLDDGRRGLVPSADLAR